MNEDIKTMEQRAHQLLNDHAYHEASELFTTLAGLYKNKEEHEQAALCFASAASCWSIESGEKTFYHAATLYRAAAHQAEAAHDYQYATLLYKHAAICFERDLEYLGFSECFFKSKECERKFLWLSIFNPRTLSATPKDPAAGKRGLAKRFLIWVVLTVSSWIWGHGERPQRTIAFGVLFVLVSAALYTQGHLISGGIVIKPSFFDAIYFSVITFTTVGYGDYVPIGLNRLLVLIEAFGGLFIIPIFITGLCRKYLRF